MDGQGEMVDWGSSFSSSVEPIPNTAGARSEGFNMNFSNSHQSRWVISLLKPRNSSGTAIRSEPISSRFMVGEFCELRMGNTSR